jgi:hypothetical protein
MTKLLLYNIDEDDDDDYDDDNNSNNNNSAEYIGLVSISFDITIR